MECCLKRPRCARVYRLQSTIRAGRQQVGLKMTYLVFFNNVHSTIVDDMEQNLVWLPCSSVQPTNFSLPELSRIPRAAPGVVKYAEVSSRLKTFRKRLGAPWFADDDQDIFFPSAATDSTADNLSSTLLYAGGWSCKHMLRLEKLWNKKATLSLFIIFPGCHIHNFFYNSTRSFSASPKMTIPNSPRGFMLYKHFLCLKSYETNACLPWILVRFLFLGSSYCAVSRLHQASSSRASKPFYPLSQELCYKNAVFRTSNKSSKCIFKLRIVCSRRFLV